MLTGQQGGRRDNCNLYTRHGSHKSSTDSDLGFTKAHIATNQTIHWFSGREIGQNIVNRAQLIVRFDIWKTRQKLIPKPIWRVQCGRRAQRTFGCHADKSLCNLANAVLEFGLFRLPSATAQFVQQPCVVTEFR